MPGNSFHYTINRILIKRVPCPFSFENASIKSQVAKKVAPLHSITTVSRIASSGTPRRASSNLSWRISLIASVKL